MENLYDELSKLITKDRILLNEPMYKHTTFRIGGNADIFIKIQNLEELKNVLKIAKNTTVTIIGNGSNVLVKDNGIRGIVLKLDFNEIKYNGEYIECGAGVNLEKLLNFTYENSLEGVEFVTGIPGTVGGAIRMNAGAHEKSFGEVVFETTYMDLSGNISILNNEEQKFTYRHSIFEKLPGFIVSTKIKLYNGKQEEIIKKITEYRLQRKNKQNVGYPNAGSIFKRGNNYISAELIDKSELKGYKVGNAMVSTVHAGFIVNTGGATAKDVLELIEHIRRIVYQKYNINLELEIIVLGE